MTSPFLAYISDGQLHVQSDGGAQVLESAFGRSLRDRAIQIHNRNAWKLQGRGGRALSRAIRAPEERDPSEFRIAITGVSRGANPGELLYTLETDEISGVFVRNAEGVETRLFHTADFRACHPALSPGGSEIAVSINHRNNVANLAVLQSDGSDLTEVTDGDSLDRAPQWVPGQARQVVFQSAGIARDSGGRFSGYGPSTIQQIDLDTGDVSCRAQETNFDCLLPRVAADGSLYYIRKPDERAPQPADPAVALQRTVLLPFRILWVIGKLIDFYVERRTGQTLFSPNNASPAVVETPSSWLLMRQPAGSASVETVAKSVRMFDLAPDGSVIYSNGVDIYRLPANGGSASKVFSQANIEVLVAL